MIAEFIRPVEYTATDLAPVLDFKVHRLEVTVKVTLPYELCTTFSAGQLQEETKLSQIVYASSMERLTTYKTKIPFPLHSIPTETFSLEIYTRYL